MTRKPRLCRRLTSASSAGDEITSSPDATTAIVGTCGFGGAAGFSGTLALAMRGAGAFCAACAAGRSRNASPPACDARAAGAPDASADASPEGGAPGAVVGAAASGSATGGGEGGAVRVGTLAAAVIVAGLVATGVLAALGEVVTVGVVVELVAAVDVERPGM